jgi:hypothetical protein
MTRSVFPATIGRWRRSPGEPPRRRARWRRFVQPGCGAGGFAAAAETTEVRAEAESLDHVVALDGWPERRFARREAPWVGAVLGPGRRVEIISSEEE